MKPTERDLMVARAVRGACWGQCGWHEDMDLTALLSSLPEPAEHEQEWWRWKAPRFAEHEQAAQGAGRPSCRTCGWRWQDCTCAPVDTYAQGLTDGRAEGLAEGLAEGARVERERRQVVIDAMCKVRDAAMEYRLLDDSDQCDAVAANDARLVLYAELDRCERTLRAAQGEPGGLRPMPQDSDDPDPPRELLNETNCVSPTADHDHARCIEEEPK